MCVGNYLKLLRSTTVLHEEIEGVEYDVEYEPAHGGTEERLAMLVGETDPRTPMGPADRAPFGSAGGRDHTKSRSRRSTRAVYPASELSGEITLLLLLV